MGKELRWQSWIFDMFVLDHIDQEFHSLKSLELKFGFFFKFRIFRIFRKNTC